MSKIAKLLWLKHGFYGNDKLNVLYNFVGEFKDKIVKALDSMLKMLKKRRENKIKQLFNVTIQLFNALWKSVARVGHTSLY